MAHLISAPALGRLRTAEMTALWQLYEQTDGANWHQNDNWDPGNDPCRLFRAKKPYLYEAPVVFTDEWYEPTPWYGVGCSDPCDDYLDGDACYHGRATALRLRENNLRGNLSWTAVGAMANLTVIDLAYNSIDGMLPTEVGRINNLEFLNLQTTQLEGTLPTELGMLNAHGATAHRLRELTVHETSLSGALPSQLGRLTELQYLDATKLQLSGTVPPQAAQLTALQVLHLSENALSGSLPPALGSNMSQMRWVQLQQNKLTGQLPTAFGEMVEVSRLLVHQNALSGSLPTQLGQLSALRLLALNDNAIGGAIPTQIGRLDGLHVLDLYNNQLTGDPPASLSQLVNLKQLYLDNEQLTPLRVWYCRQRMPAVGKYNYRILREEWHRISQAYCEDPYTTTEAFGSLDEIEAEAAANADPYADPYG